MNWKNFFKPTKAKIILAVIIAVINIGAAFYSANAVLCTEGCIPSNSIQKILSPSIEPFTIVMVASEFFEEIDFLPEPIFIILMIIISLFIFILFWYLLSCIILKIKSLFVK
ncbi:hypothetical protein A2442_00715 [Candidatus Campbellbacteria bacterium RIFOXYC2_FULL_35_25]|uniref:Uncharacterized protein n=1 Tax=Candidatus Campbellbacteria bacterium RIFOXYC2_FULL_35_25 TaxID=1797582 RepID=A0A1F5EIL8_9BACT|nr:MAG: hypothetical protein A2442_00715 [Candidatus Campbellbacteria bacterium RIFOXYC2_FULL_35_25]